MSFDAQALWWPPFQKLYNQLETLKLEPSAVPADVLRSTLAGVWLGQGSRKQQLLPHSIPALAMLCCWP